jgi:TetR/AcrR family transcriptional regulator
VTIDLPAQVDAEARPRSQRRTRARVKARIMRAAEGVFAEAGFSGASMQAIAEAAGLPKANIHYYFGTKEALYHELLSEILDRWVGAFDHFQAGRDPRQAFEAYVREKMSSARERPIASKVFAQEVIHGAQHIGDYLRNKLRQRVMATAPVLERWVADGRMAPVDPVHLFFSLWALTQTYADFDSQIAAVLDREALGDRDFERATAHVLSFVLRACGLSGNDAPPTQTG